MVLLSGRSRWVSGGSLKPPCSLRPPIGSYKSRLFLFELEDISDKIIKTNAPKTNTHTHTHTHYLHLKLLVLNPGADPADVLLIACQTTGINFNLQACTCISAVNELCE